MYHENLKNIERLYEKIIPKIQKIEKILGIIFLQEIQVITDYQGNIKDIILLLWDIEWFSYKSKKNVCFEILLFSKIFQFEAKDTLLDCIDKFLNNGFCRGIDQYHGISLIDYTVKSYYWIVWGIRPEYGTINMNFYASAIPQIKKIFPKYSETMDFRPLWSLFLDFIWNEINEKKLYSYELNSLRFKNIASFKKDSIYEENIKKYLEIFLDLDNSDYWQEYISWSWHNFNTGEKSFLCEFFLKSQKRKKIFQDYEIFNGNFIDPYICEIFENQDIIKTWFLVKDSYEHRKNKGMYNHQIWF